MDNRKEKPKTGSKRAEIRLRLQWGKDEKKKADFLESVKNAREENRLDAAKIIYQGLTREVLEILSDPFGDYYKAPQQFLNIKTARELTKESVEKVPLYNISRDEAIAAIEEGIAGLDFTLIENELFSAVLKAFSDNDWPEAVDVTRAGLYSLLGVEQTRDKTGRLKWRDGWQIRRGIERALEKIEKKQPLIVFNRQTGTDKKGKPIYESIQGKIPLIRLLKTYRNVSEAELPLISKDQKTQARRFSHYTITLNKALKGDVNRYFKLLPNALGAELRTFRGGRGQRVRTEEFNFIVFCFSQWTDRIEINADLLAERCRIKSKHAYKRRELLRRCRESAIGLGYVLEWLEDQPAARAGRKEIITLNRSKFYHLQQRRLPFAGEKGR